MNKLSKCLIVLFLAFFIGSYFGIDFVQSQNNNLVLEITKECDIQYTGDSCVAELKLFNNSDEILDGTAFLYIDYQGVCGDGFFDGEGIAAQFSIDNANWLDFSNWDNGTATVSGFDIIKGEAQPKLKITTIPNLCPGNYIFIFTINGTAETGEEHTTAPITLGSSGAWGLSAGTTIQYEDSQIGDDSAGGDTGDAGEDEQGDEQGSGDEDEAVADDSFVNSHLDPVLNYSEPAGEESFASGHSERSEESLGLSQNFPASAGDSSVVELPQNDEDGAYQFNDDSKFLASIGAFFGDLEGWRLALMFLLGIILALIIMRLIKSRIDRKNSNS